MSVQAPAAGQPLPRRSLSSVALQGATWTVGIYAVSVVLRFGANVVLSRLVTPEIFGAILIIMTLRNGADLLSDFGIGQNVVNNRNGEQADFYNTAWTVQIMRGLVLFVILTLSAPALAYLYEIPQSYIQVGALTLAILGFTSTSVFMMQRKLHLARFNLFELCQDVVSLTCSLAAAVISPTVWSLLIANVVAIMVRVVSTFFLPGSNNRLAFRRGYFLEMLSFGKWIYLWSLLGFFCINFDRLYLGHAASLAALGVYGIARTIAELPVTLAGRLGHSLIFPLISSTGHTDRSELRGAVAPLRLKLLLAASACMALAVVFSDIFVEFLYDGRYHDAGWMLPTLLLGGWAAMLCSVGEYTLMGLGRPLYGAGANCSKLVYLAVALPMGFAAYGVFGAILAIASAEFARYVALSIGQMRERIAFFGQDLVATACLIAIVALLASLRQALGFGTPFTVGVLL